MGIKNYMMNVQDVCNELNCSRSFAYKLIKGMNQELSARGFITMPGRIPRPFYEEKLYGYKTA